MSNLHDDYDVFFDPDPEQLRAWIPKAKTFIDTVLALLNEPSD